MRPVTWATCARINATRWGALGAAFGLAATAVCWWRQR
jgi:hypothetical protein